MANAKIICTLGPTSETVAVLEQMIEAGMNAARLNFSHGTHDEHMIRVRNLRSAMRRTGKPIAILQDVQGPKIRLGLFQDGQMPVKPGQILTLTHKNLIGSGGIVPVKIRSLCDDVVRGDSILIDDGRIQLVAISVGKKDVKARVVIGGVLKDRKGINLPSSPVSVSAITHKDKIDLAFGQKIGVDFVALSFVRNAKDVQTARKLVAQRRTPLIAKIEKSQAVAALTEIALVSDGVMVARGDLGIEMPLESLPGLQKRAVTDVARLGRLTIVATEMLESMTFSARPTRAEVSDVANAIYDGADVVMLSGETAVGKFPVQAVDTMRRIVEAAEAENRSRRAPPFVGSSEVSTGVAAAAVAAADQLGVQTIVAYTERGYTARLISEFRPKARILALTPNAEIVRRVQLYWGVEGKQVGRLHSTDAMVNQVRRVCRSDKRCIRGKPVIIVAGVPLNEPGNTNLMTVHEI